MGTVCRIGLDIAKEYFQAHGVDKNGKELFNRKLRRNQVLSFFANLPPCVVGLEACGGAHYWARELSKLDAGHTVHLISPRHVKPFVLNNKMTAFNRERLACAYFFAVPGLTYGIFTARLPALKKMVAADDTMIGVLLLVFGAASFTGLVASRHLVARFGTKILLGATCVLMPLFLTVAAVAWNYWTLTLFCMFGGCAGGIAEVAMNTQGMGIEARFNKMCMSSLHACFSLGGLLGSLGGALFAYFNLSAALNFLIVCALYLFLLPAAFRNLVSTGKKAEREKRSKKPRAKIPAFIHVCGLISMLCYISEGSVGEWGSILLHSVKGAPQDQAALVFGCFCSSMVVFRLIGDRLRQTFSDLAIACVGSLVGAICMATVLLAKTPLVCLLAYMAMGACFAPIVPILFSRAGKCEGIAPERASAAISIMSYTGLLVFPPLLGMLGDGLGLDRALWIIVAACVCICIGCYRLFGKKSSTGVCSRG